MNASGALVIGVSMAISAATTLVAQDTTRARVQVRPVPRELRVPGVGVAPTVTGVKPVGVRLAAGTAVTIDGTGFVSGATVTIGGAAATNVVVVSATQLRVTTPAGTAGARDVVVTTSGGSATCAGCLTYDGALGVGEFIEEMWERGGEGPTGVWGEERFQKGVGAYVHLTAQCPSNWLPIGAGISNSGNKVFFMAESYPLNNQWHVLMQRMMVPPQGGALLYPPAPYSFFLTVRCINRDAFNRAMRAPPSS